jgi:hypothetical protein
MLAYLIYKEPTNQIRYQIRDGRGIGMTTTDASKGLSKDEFLYRAFLVVGICGITSALLDLDHSWKYFGFTEPFNFTGWYGRPLHSPVVLLLVSLALSVILVSLGYGRNLAIPLWLVKSRTEDDKEQSLTIPLWLPRTEDDDEQ